MLCDLNTLLQEKVIKRLKIDDIHNLCLTTKQCYNKYSEDSRLWAALAKTQFTSNRLANENPMLYYYMNKVNVYAIGKNFDNMFGFKSEFLTELTPILSGVKTLVMGLGTTFAIKYDNSLHYMGDHSYRRNFSLSGNVFPKNVKNVLVTENYLGLVLTLDGVLYHTGDESLYKVMDKVRKIHHVPETDDFLIERDDGMFLITAESMLNTKGVNVQMKFKTYRDLGEEMIYNIEILIEGEYQRTLNYFTYDYIITNDNRLYNIKYDLKIANSVLSFERLDYTEVNAVILSSTDGYFNKSMIIDDGHTIPHLKNIFSIKFESPIIKM